MDGDAGIGCPGIGIERVWPEAFYGAWSHEVGERRPYLLTSPGQTSFNLSAAHSALGLPPFKQSLN